MSLRLWQGLGDLINLATRVALRAVGALDRRLTIALFHRVLPRPDPLLVDEPDIRRFAEQMRWLASTFRVLPLPEALQRLYEGCLPSGALAISFDDGYQDNVLNALPILRELGLPATFFVTTGFIEGGMMWNDRVLEAVRHWPHARVNLTDLGLGNFDLGVGRATVMDQLLGALKYRPYQERDALSAALLERSGAPPIRKMLNEQEIRRLRAAGMSIGGHTENHPILHGLDRGDAEREIVENKRRLEAVLGEALDIFAYPNGKPFRDFDAREIEVLRASGYRYAMTTAVGAANAATPPYQIPRFTPWDLQRHKYLARMLVNYFRAPTRVPEAPVA